MKLALISVSDKTNLTDFCLYLFSNNYKIISTGGTYKHILTNLGKSKCKNKLISVEEFTGFPEILNGRVKTLHPKIYAGLLYDPDIPDHLEDFNKYNNSNNENYNLHKIDLVVVNLYPFETVVKNKNSTHEEIIENIDIGGVSLLRASAKNYNNVIVLTDINDYSKFINYNSMYDNLVFFKKELATKALEHVTDYDANITNYLDNRIKYRKYIHQERLKYGCNPYQHNAYISTINDKKLPYVVINGYPGYINYLDAFQSWLLVNEANSKLGYSVATSYKHTAPAGVGTSKYDITKLEEKVYDISHMNINNSESAKAFIRARNSDPLSSFGDFIAISCVVDETCAKLIKREVSDGIIAANYTPEALKILSNKKNGKYVIIKGDTNINYNDIEYKEIFGVSIAQTANSELIDDSYFQDIPTNKNLLEQNKKEDMILATITLKYTPSNSIAIAHNNQVIGVGAGQQNRVDCIKLAGNKAKLFNMRFSQKCIDLLDKFKNDIKRQDRVNAIIKYINNDFLSSELENWYSLFDSKPELLNETNFNNNKPNGLVLSSDAFFPFRDNIDYAQRYGVNYILNPGGSIQDKNIIEACNEYDILMAMSHKRMFYH